MVSLHELALSQTNVSEQFQTLKHVNNVRYADTSKKRDKVDSWSLILTNQAADWADDCGIKKHARRSKDKQNLRTLSCENEKWSIVKAGLSNLRHLGRCNHAHMIHVHSFPVNGICKRVDLECSRS